MNKHLDITVHGRVQGVGFRAFVKRKAVEMGIKGTVRNQANGTVFIEAEGEGIYLDKLIMMCKSGPSFSNVNRVDAEAGDILNYSSFSIVH